MATSSTDIQITIDSTKALLDSTIAAIADLVSNPKVSYSIDGQSVSWNERLSQLNAIVKETDELIRNLIKTQNLLQPYQFQSSGSRRY